MKTFCVEYASGTKVNFQGNVWKVEDGILYITNSRLSKTYMIQLSLVLYVTIK